MVRKSPLRKRHLRDLMSDFGKYLVIFLLMTLSIAEISGFLVADESMIEAYNESFEKYNIEDGNFTAEKELSARQREILNSSGVTVYDLLSADRVADSGQKLRIFSMREEVDLACLMGGEFPDALDEIAIDRMFADNNDLTPGDTIVIDNTVYTITGLVALSDYSTMFENNNEMMFDAKSFGVAVVTKEAFESFDRDVISWRYAWKYDVAPADEAQEDEMSQEFLKRLSSTVSLKQYIPRYQNQAITFTGDDMGSDKAMMSIFLYIIILIIAFVFAITTSNTIVKEATVIGTLRATGYTKGELIRHYMAMPVIVTVIAAIAGNVLGYTVMKDVNAGLYYGSYSLPTYVTRWNISAFLETTVLPLIIMVVINFFILTRRLKCTPLQFLRRDLRRGRRRGAVHLSEKLPVFTRFRLRIMFQNMSNYVLLLVGILFANFLLMFGLMFPSVLKNYMDAIPDNMLSKYQYILQLPSGALNDDKKTESLVNMLLFKEAVETETPGAEKFSAYALKTLPRPGIHDDDIQIYGIQKDSGYVDIEFSGNGVWVSESYAEKQMVKAGDTIVLTEPYEDTLYEFTITGIYPYSGAMCIFMDMDALNETFDLGEGTFAGYFSDEEITDIDEKYIGQTVDFDSLSKISRQLEISMGSMMDVVCVFAVIMYVILIYLMSKIIIEKNANSISMTKILGYSNGEISRLYILVTTILVLVFMVFSIQPEVFVLTAVFRIMIRSEMAGWIPFILSNDVYVKMIILGFASYAVVAVFELHKIRKVPMDTALKNVE